MSTESILLDRDDYSSEDDVLFDYAIYVDGYLQIFASTRGEAESVSIVMARGLANEPSADFKYYVNGREFGEAFGVFEVIANYKNSVTAYDVVVHVVEYKLTSHES